MRLSMRSFPVLLALLLCLSPRPSVAQSTLPTATNRVADVLESLKVNPSDVNLLVRLQNAIKTEPDQHEKTRGLAAYSLGCLLLNKNQAAQQAVDYLRKNYPASPYVAQVTWDNLSRPCAACGGNGSLEKPCPRCKGSGTCISCNGAGSVQGITGPLRCAGCTGTGKCRECNGTGTVRQKCAQCGGNGLVFDRSKAQQTYTAILREKELAEQQRQEAQRLRQQASAEEAAAKARQAEEERKLLEEQRKAATQLQPVEIAAAPSASATQTPTPPRTTAPSLEHQTPRAAKIAGLSTKAKAGYATDIDLQQVLVDPGKYQEQVLRSYGYIVDAIGGGQVVMIAATEDEAMTYTGGETVPGSTFLPSDGDVGKKAARVKSAVGPGGMVSLTYALLGTEFNDRILFDVDLPTAPRPKPPEQAPVPAHEAKAPGTEPPPSALDAFLGFIGLVVIVAGFVLISKYRRSQPVVSTAPTPTQAGQPGVVGGRPQPGILKILMRECCPRCYSTSFQVVANTTGTTQGFSGAKGCLGVLLTGGCLGWFCGMCGQGKGKTSTTMVKYCNECGKKF